MRARNIGLVLAAVLIAAMSYVGFGRTMATNQPVAVAPLAGAPIEIRPDLDRLIGIYENRTASSADPLDFRYLGRLYLAKANLSANTNHYRQAREALTRALDLYPGDIEATGLEAQAAFSLHDFAAAQSLAERWLALDPDSIDATALVGDIELAVGNVGEARRAFETLVRAAPTHPAVQARLAQLAVAEGDPIDGLSRATIAESAAGEMGFGGPALAWYQSFSGQLAFDVGQYERSERSFAAALENLPGSAHDQAGLARAKAAQGDVAEAIDLLELATADIGAVDDLGYLGDLYLEAGLTGQAEATFARIEAQLRDGSLDTTVHKRLAALYLLDHEIHLDLALELAEEDLALRQDSGAYDTYAWALFKNGRVDEAEAASAVAMASGLKEPALYYHAGLIAHALGNQPLAIANLETALQISPRFHPIQASEAIRLLESLRR